MTPRLTFNEKNHRYTLVTPEGVKVIVPGVTSLLGGGIPKPALVPWAARRVAEYVDANPLEIERLRGEPEVPYRGGTRSALVAALCKVPNNERDQAAVRGTEIHSLAEKVVAGDEVEVPAAHEAEVTGYAELLDAWDITPLLVEARGANVTDFYAGTMDLVGTSPHLAGGKPFLLDVKTSNGVYPETALQCAAYANFEFVLGPEGEEHTMPRTEACYVAHVTPHGAYLRPLCRNRAEMDEAYTQFKCAAYTAKCQKRRDAFLGEPLVAPEQEAENARAA